MPGSKSHTIRCVAMASLASGTSKIYAPLDSADTISAVESYRILGAKIDLGKDCWEVTGFNGRPEPIRDRIDVGNSGTTMRFAIGTSSLLEPGQEITLDGDSQIRTRPQGPLIDSLNDLGARCISVSNDGRPPIIVNGKLKGGKTSISCKSSQYLSSLLFHLPLAENDSEVTVPLLYEKPYVHITMKYLDLQGIKYTASPDIQHFTIPGGQQFKAMDYKVAADFSSATFFLCAGAFLDADITLTGLDFNDAQGDKAVVDILRKMGANITITPNGVRVTPGELRGITVDMNAIPDALPALAATACFAQGETRFVNVAQARMKETDRIAVMAQELAKLGAETQELPDGLIIRPGKLKPCKELCGHGDHRIVMALSLAAMALDGESVINTAEAMAITFPNFVELMNTLGGDMAKSQE
ncbi:MAG: 3-phosphoshikimate 1-carboxyvinyltransferase [Sedimentisphaerales bacterium]|nr:3-phosphoshikimate 1-carboxyvinyltransferase [Sedimentisphaerales bacterium]